MGVLQVSGHSYIDIETLAQITNGSVKFEPNQIVLIIPNSNFDANSPQSQRSAVKDFASAAFATLAEIKEWKGVLGTMVTFGVGGSITSVRRLAWSKPLSQRQPIQTTTLFSCSAISLQTWRSGKVLSLRNARITIEPGPWLRIRWKLTRSDEILELRQISDDDAW